MSFIQNYIIVFAFILFAINISAEIEMDYFYGKEVLRSPNMKCRSLELKKECRALCGPDNYGCIFDDCVCLDQNLKKPKKANEENLPPSKKELKMFLKEFEDLVDGFRRYIYDADEEPDVSLEEHPALRHHIAHFCPNLEVARSCIRTCMKVGKPAFCGKDHICYCGHKYNERDEDAKVDAEDIYASFRDIYTKYFGADDSANSKPQIIINKNN